MANRMKLPAVIPAGWTIARINEGEALVQRTRTGLAVMFSIDVIDTPEPHEALGAGVFRHISISRKDRYPAWDEMRDLVYGCGFFDKTMDVVMYLPPKERYVNTHPYTFHYYQRLIV
jgi:hypothetical protein